MRKKKQDIKVVPNRLQKVVIFDEHNKPIIAEEAKSVITFLCDETGVKLSVSGINDIKLIEILAKNSSKLFTDIIAQYYKVAKQLKISNQTKK